MIVKDLKIYYFVTEYSGFFNDLNSKIINFFRASPENTPLKYDRYELGEYDVQHTDTLSNLDLLQGEVLYWKGLPVLNKDNSSVLYDDDDPEMYVSNSSDLLLGFLWKLYMGWKGALSILDELSSNDKYKIDNLEYKLIYFIIDLIPVIQEVLTILYSWHDVISLAPIKFHKDLCYYTILHENPVFINHSANEKYLNCSKEFWIKKIIEGTLLSKNLIEIFDASLRQKIEYRYRIKNLDPKSAIEFVLRETLSGIDIKTLQFLGLNPPADFEAMRGRSYLCPKKK